MERIPTPTMGEFLLEEFIIPLHISAYKLAHAIHVPVSRIQDILHNRRKVTVDTSMRLGKYFGVSELLFFKIQNDLDIREAREKIIDDLDKIVPITSANL